MQMQRTMMNLDDIGSMSTLLIYSKCENRAQHQRAAHLADRFRGFLHALMQGALARFGDFRSSSRRKSRIRRFGAEKIEAGVSKLMMVSLGSGSPIDYTDAHAFIMRIEICKYETSVGSNFVSSPSSLHIYVRRLNPSCTSIL